MRIFILLFFISCIACKTDKNNNDIKGTNESEIQFDKEKWLTKDGKDYPYRDKMINDILYNDTIRTLNKEQVLELLGQPDYSKEGHLYYRITESRLGNWTLKTKTMVIKLVEDNYIDWIKVHG